MSLPPEIRTTEQLGRCTILLVEDEPFVREATCNILRSEGFSVLPAENAASAAAIADAIYESTARRIDLVMSDMVLPGKSGQQLGRELREQTPEIAVLLTSGYTNIGPELEAPESRTFFLSKPYSKQTLISKIEKILNSRSPKTTTPAN